MRDDEREPRCDKGVIWRVEIDLPEEMVQDFRHWWESQGWWNFRSWHERSTGQVSEWEKFMRRLWGEPLPENPLAASSKPPEPPSKI